MQHMRAVDTDEVCDALLEQAGRGDREAMGKLFSSEAGRLIAIARRIVRRREVAEEIVQEAFVSAWRSAARFDRARGNARAWLTTIVRNRALNSIRDSQRIELATEDELAAWADRASDATVAYDALGSNEALKRCLEALEPRRRRSLLLAYVAGFSHGEIAADLSVPLGTVKAWIRRSVVALQECLS
jgi:RNA polymerase sigma-70 factor (ECF subfamily)